MEWGISLHMIAISLLLWGIWRSLDRIGDALLKQKGGNGRPIPAPAESTDPAGREDRAPETANAGNDLPPKDL